MLNAWLCARFKFLYFLIIILMYKSRMIFNRMEVASIVCDTALILQASSVILEQASLDRHCTWNNLWTYKSFEKPLHVQCRKIWQLICIYTGVCTDICDAQTLVLHIPIYCLHGLLNVNTFTKTVNCCIVMCAILLCFFIHATTSTCDIKVAKWRCR